MQEFGLMIWNNPRAVEANIILSSRMAWRAWPKYGPSILAAHENPTNQIVANSQDPGNWQGRMLGGFQNWWVRAVSKVKTMVFDRFRGTPILERPQKCSCPTRTQSHVFSA